MKKLLSFITALTLACGTVIPACAEKVTFFGDLNSDRAVNVTDLSIMAAYVKGESAPDLSLPQLTSIADLNCDYILDTTDIVMMAAQIKGVKSYTSKMDPEEDVFKMYEDLKKLFEDNGYYASAGLGKRDDEPRLKVGIDYMGWAREYLTEDYAAYEGDTEYQKLIDEITRERLSQVEEKNEEVMKAIEDIAKKNNFDLHDPAKFDIITLT